MLDKTFSGSFKDLLWLSFFVCVVFVGSFYLLYDWYLLPNAQRSFEVFLFEGIESNIRGCLDDEKAFGFRIGVKDDASRVILPYCFGVVNKEELQLILSENILLNMRGV